MDSAHLATDKKIAALERRLKKEYRQASQEVAEKTREYLRRFEVKDELKRKAMDKGVITSKDYLEWKKSQIMGGKRWQKLTTDIAKEYTAAGQEAAEMIRDMQADVYALNRNYGTYEAEHLSRVDTSFTLYDKNTARRIMKDNPELLPPPGKAVSQAIREGRAMRWNRRQVQSVMMQGIIQGESIPKLATRLADTVGESNRKATVRNARTMATAAQNAGRLDAYARARDYGIKMAQEWIATLDGRTRHEHRILNNQVREIGEEFEAEGYKIMYPGDPSADPEMIYNCRCTLVGRLVGLEYEDKRVMDPALGNMTYEEWLEAKPKSNPILLPEEKARDIEASYVADYRRLRKIVAG